MKLKDALHNPRGTVAVGSGWAARRFFAANSMPIGKKNNAADRPSPTDHRLQGVMRSILNYENTAFLEFTGDLPSPVVATNDSMATLNTPSSDDTSKHHAQRHTQHPGPGHHPQEHQEKSGPQSAGQIEFHFDGKRNGDYSGAETLDC